MATDRIRQLEEFYREEPGDPFNAYALALEYLKVEPLRSRSLFENLLQHHKTYLPTYYHAARLYQDLGETEKAVTTYEDGIALAQECNDLKARRELQSAYDEMTFG